MGSVFVSGGASLASPAFTGTPTAPTAAASTDTTQVATTEFTHDAIAAQAGVSQWLTIPITTDLNGDNADTGIDLTLGAVVVAAAWTTTVADATESIFCGTLSGPQDWLNFGSVSATGFTVAEVGVAEGGLLYSGGTTRFTPVAVTADRQRVYVSATGTTTWRGKIHILYFNPPA